MSIYKKFIQYYKPYQRLFYFDLFCALVVSLIDLAFPQILYYLTHGVFNGDATEILNVIGFVGLGMLIMYSIRYACQYYITTWGI